MRYRVVPRVLAVQHGVDDTNVEQAVVTDGEAALALVDREPFDAVLLDLNLPPLDSWFVLSALGHRTERPRLVVFGDASHAARAERLGADEYISGGSG